MYHGKHATKSEGIQVLSWPSSSMARWIPISARWRRSRTPSIASIPRCSRGQCSLEREHSGPTSARSTGSSAGSRSASACSGAPWMSTQRMVPSGGKATALLRDVQENAESYHFYADELLDDANTLLNVQLALASHRTSEVMRVLTVFSVFFLPLTFIVGMYGMNFHYMPELRERWGYPGGDAADGRGDAADLPLVPPPGLAPRMTAFGLAPGRAGSARGPPGCWPPGGRGRGRRPACLPHLLPDPALDWLRRAPRRHRGLGRRAGRPRGRAPRRARGGPGAALGGADRGRGPAAGAGAGSGAERGGADGGWHAGVPRRRRRRCRAAPARRVRRRSAWTWREIDLRRPGRWRAPPAPAAFELAQANTQEASLESVGSVGLGSPTSWSGCWMRRSSSPCESERAAGRGAHH